MAKSNKKTLRLAGIFIVLLGFIFAASGGGLTYFSYTFSQTAIPTSGVVTHVEVNWSSNSNGGGSSPTYKPTISFFDNNGTQQSAQTYLSSSSYDYPIGTKLQILYRADDPSSMRLNNWFALWGFGLIFFGVGLLTIFGGIMFFVVSNKAKPQSDAPDAAAEPKVSKAYSYSSADESEKRAPTIRRQ